MTPIELLKKELAELQRSLNKSKEAYAKQELSLAQHQIHLRNLIPLIGKYEQAIKKLS